MTGLAAVVLSLFLGQAPPVSMAEWRSRWMDADGYILLYEAPPLDIQKGRFETSRNLCQSDLRYIINNGSPAEAFEAQRSMNFFSIVYNFKEAP